MNITQEAEDQSSKSVKLKSFDFQLPKVVGSYDLGGVRFGLTKKPNKFNRLMVKIFLGWTWKD
jgi:hypothetical protein|tara:strand:- start:177 stop:365 length:189 start_codon:yes stop_codon:yes gene_type:complete